MIFLRVLGLVLLVLAAADSPSRADEEQLRAIVAKFAAARSFQATELVVRELAGTGDPVVERPLAALADGDLIIRRADSILCRKPSHRRDSCHDPA